MVTRGEVGLLIAIGVLGLVFVVMLLAMCGGIWF
jgi:hypothetical protein